MYASTLKPYDIFKGKNALISTVHYAMVYTNWKLVVCYFRCSIMLWFLFLAKHYSNYITSRGGNQAEKLSAAQIVESLCTFYGA
jgi:hypothetical protein